MAETNEDKLVNFQQIRQYLSNRENIVSILKTIIPYILIYVVILYVFNRFEISPEKIQTTFAGMGMYLVPGFIFIQLLASLTPLPDLPFIATGILFFKPWASFVLIWIGMWLGSVINFYIARRLGRNAVLSRYPKTADWLDRFTGKYWFETTVVGRSFMFVTFDLIAYAAGISNLSFKKFAFASIFGIIPVALNALLVGLAFTSGDLLKTGLYGAITGLIAIFMGIAGKFFRSRWEKIYPTD